MSLPARDQQPAPDPHRLVLSGVSCCFLVPAKQRQVHCSCGGHRYHCRNSTSTALCVGAVHCCHAARCRPCSCVVSANCRRQRHGEQSVLVTAAALQSARFASPSRVNQAGLCLLAPDRCAMQELRQATICAQLVVHTAEEHCAHPISVAAVGVRGKNATEQNLQCTRLSAVSPPSLSTSCTG